MIKMFKDKLIQVNWKTEWFPLAIIIFLFISAIYFYSIFPDRVPVHWNFAAYPDRFAPAYLAAFLMPVASLIIYLLLLFIPKFDFYRSSYTKFTKTYLHLKDTIMVFLALIYFFVSLAALGYAIQVNFWVPLFMAILFFCFGGIWFKIRPITGRSFMVSGILIVLIAIAPSAWRWPIFILAIVIIILFPIIYSLIFNKKSFKN